LHLDKIDEEPFDYVIHFIKYTDKLKYFYLEIDKCDISKKEISRLLEELMKIEVLDQLCLKIN